MQFFQSKKSVGDIQNGSTLQGYLTGWMVIASPFMTDPRFSQSVIYICGHDKNGAMGFILNRPLPFVDSQDLMKQLEINGDYFKDRFSIYYGGPVDVGRGFILHATDYTHPSSIKLNEDFSITATLEILHTMSKQDGPEYSYFMLGYTGWGPGQLEQELTGNQWHVMPGSKSFVYKTPSETMWLGAYECLGINPNHIFLEMGHA